MILIELVSICAPPLLKSIYQRFAADEEEVLLRGLGAILEVEYAILASI